MPINIYDNDTFDSIDHLAENNWDLPTQIDCLEKWLKDNEDKIPKGKYVADIGFDIRKDANGGGSVINLKMISILAKIGMEIYLSEYPKTE